MRLRSIAQVKEDVKCCTIMCGSYHWTIQLPMLLLRRFQRYSVYIQIRIVREMIHFGEDAPTWLRFYNDSFVKMKVGV